MDWYVCISTDDTGKLAFLWWHGETREVMYEERNIMARSRNNFSRENSIIPSSFTGNIEVINGIHTLTILQCRLV